MTTKTYACADPAALAAKIKAAGGPPIDPKQPTGRATADGVTLAWLIGAAGVSVTLVSKPWFISEGTVWSHVDALFGAPTP